MCDELVKRLRERSVFLSPHHGEGRSYDADLMHEAADAIEVLSKKENTAPRWISSEERLPERNGTYLVYVYGEVSDMNFWHGKWHRFGDDYTKAVTHWMPLPEPPKEEK